MELMSEMGQNAKYSLRADVFCCASNNGHRSIPPPCRKSANVIDQFVGIYSGMTFVTQRLSSNDTERIGRARGAA
jgi:hypothetical protein